ncbi:hypothetical protein BT63DRAFT_84129 [Microthyrium microscopicum]|uniref:HIG1 domain-containing protein n=1 Tax=Microthyrium microscopicum TaxID=703497 RepID=A0A6A6TYB5_9PEZI|nr:hypothetical protein BT63DRAFT_84129 [Microthyrium microscopicum]
MPSPPPSSFDPDYIPETPTRRLFRRMREEPLIPLGLVLTVSALIGAGRALRANDHQRANIMFRRRVYAQGFTLLCVCAGGLYWSKDRERRQQFDRLERERVAADKRERWLAELQARDDEEKKAKGRVGLLKEKRRQREEVIREKIREEERVERERAVERELNGDIGSREPRKGEDGYENFVQKAAKLVWTGGDK